VGELECFELLLTISGIGPKSAIQILDQASKDLIYEAARLEDPIHLHKLSGISKKTAEKIILGLKDKISDDMVTPTTTKEDTTMYQDAFDTLVTLGYNPLSVRQVLEANPTAVSTSALVTAALRQLSS
jgi:Holliday junction DNA helicase RuvA